MNAAIIVIGDEITSGRKIDTNSSYLARELGEIGISVARIVGVGDDIKEAAGVLREAARDYRLVLVTGGLGPTHDDLTRQALAEAFGTRLVLDKPTAAYIEERFRARGLEAPEAVKAMALVPEGARTLANPVGTAPGLVWVERGTEIYVLPGVPSEAKAIFSTSVAPELRRRSGRDFIKTRVLRTVGITESEISEKLAKVIPELKVRLAFLPEATGVDLALTATAGDEAQTLAALESAVSEIVPLIGDRVYSLTGEEIHTVVGEMLIEHRKTLAVAESCTGGLVAHLLTEVPGISASLERGIVAYSNKAKVETLGVCSDLIAEHGAVSEEVARAMASGVRERAATDLGLATTGIAGPTGGTETKPVGLVYLALAYRGGCEIARHVLTGGRDLVKRRAAVRALDMVRCYLASRE